MGQDQDLVRRQFGAHAERYVSSPDHSRGESLEQLVAVVAPQKRWRVLDVATGGGHTALRLASLVRDVVAVDLTPEMLEAASRLARSRGVSNVTFEPADAAALPYPDGSFDFVTSRLAAHHFRDCSRFLLEAARVLRPGGLIAVVDNVSPEDPEAARHVNEIERVRDPSHHWAHSKNDWLRLVGETGFTMTHVEEFRKVLDFDAWTSRMSVPEAVRERLQVMVQDGPEAARTALAPEWREGRFRFYLTELLLVARRPDAPKRGA